MIGSTFRVKTVQFNSAKHFNFIIIIIKNWNIRVFVIDLNVQSINNSDRNAIDGCPRVNLKFYCFVSYSVLFCPFTIVWSNSAYSKN